VITNLKVFMQPFLGDLSYLQAPPWHINLSRSHAHEFARAQTIPKEGT